MVRVMSCGFAVGLSVMAPLFVMPSCSQGGALPPGSGARDGDTGSAKDMAMSAEDLASVRDAAGDPQQDASTLHDAASRDLSSPPPDLTSALDLSSPPDMAFASSQGVDIYVDNFCRMDVIPKKFDVPAGTSLKLTYYNRSRDYPVDVWLSYGGGFLDLRQGMNWADRFEFCRYPRPYMAYADISTACSRYRLMINCL